MQTRPLAPILLAALLSRATALHAQPAPPAAAGGQPSAPAPDARELARERFERARALFQQQSWAAALAELREALRLFPTWPATSYAAHCLKKLGRFDESLDMYGALLRDFGDKLPDEARQRALQEVEEMRRLVGTIDIDGAELGAAITINQQARGDYPLLAPIRVPAGSHIVRVYKEGFEPFETRVEVAGGTSERVTARLRRLVEMGTLHVHEARGRELSVIVDGVVVGQTGAGPLSVPLSPGKHVVFLRGQGKLGTPPATVTIRVNEASPLRVEAESLDASLRLVPRPFDALVSIDGVDVGRGFWDGGVHPGRHKIEVAAEGFLPEAREVAIQENQREVIVIELSRDPDSPFWRAPPPPPHFMVELGAGAMLAPSLEGDVVGSCVGDCSQGLGVGTTGAIRGGYVLSSGVSFGLMAGYLSVSQRTSSREATLRVGPSRAVTASVDDTVELTGVLAGAWVGYSFVARLPVHLRLSAGGLLGKTSDARLGVLGTSDSPGYPVGTVSQAQAARFFYITPELRVGLPLRRGVEIYAGLEVPALFSLKRQRWSTDQGFYAGPDEGYGWFDDDTWLGGVIFSFVPGFGARFDL